MDVKDILAKYKPDKSNLLNILHDVQNHNSQNFLPKEDLKAVAKFLNTTFSSVYGVATYYSMFSLKPKGKHVIRICHSPVCRMVGSMDILRTLKETLQILPGEVTKDKLFSFELVECLGNCDKAPAMMVDDILYDNLSPQKINEIVQSFKYK